MSRCSQKTMHRPARATIGVVGGWESLACPMLLAARNLGIKVEPLQVSPTERNCDNGYDERIDRLLTAATHCDVVTFDPFAVDPLQLENLDRAGLLLRPSRPSFLLTRSPATARSTLRQSGFDVAVTPQSKVRDLTIRVVRRPSGHLIAHALAAPANNGSPPAVPGAVSQRAIEIAIAVANGLNAVGSLAVDFIVDAGNPQIHDVILGPDLRSLEARTFTVVENHLRALLDWPLLAPRERRSSSPLLSRCRAGLGNSAGIQSGLTDPAGGPRQIG